MRKFLLFLTLLVGAATAFAGEKTFSVLEGTLDRLKEGGNVVVTFDFEGATFDNREPLSVHYQNLSELIARVPTGFMQGFSEKAKKCNIVDNATDAKYSIIIEVENMDSCFQAMSIVPGHSTKVWGTATIKDNATGETVAVVRISECEGDRDFTIDDSFGKCFIKIGEGIGKAFSKGKL